MLRRDERGQSYPLLLISVFIIAALLALMVGTSWLMIRRAKMQAAADATALATAGVIAEAQETINSMEAVRYSSHAAADLLVAAGALCFFNGSGESAYQSGSKLEAFIEESLDPAMDAKVEELRQAASVDAVKNGAAYIRANGCFGIAIPWPINGLGQRAAYEAPKDDYDLYVETMRELGERVAEYDRRISEADQEMARLKQEYPSNYLEIDENSDGKSDYFQAAGSKGGSTKQKHEIERQMQSVVEERRLQWVEEAFDRQTAALGATGARGVTATVWEESELLPFFGLWSKKETGMNAAAAAARVTQSRNGVSEVNLGDLALESGFFAGLDQETATALFNAMSWMYGIASVPAGLDPAVREAMSWIAFEPPNLNARSVALARGKDVLPFDGKDDRIFSSAINVITGMVPEAAAAYRQTGQERR